MEPINESRFAVRDRIHDAEIGPQHVPLSLLDGAQQIDAHQPALDETEFQQMMQRGAAAWADVPNASDWVETLRGNRE